MSKLKQEEELVNWLDEKVDNYSEQAYQQIRECISLAHTLPGVLASMQKKLVIQLNDLIWYVDSEIDEIEKDPRFHYETAIVQVNAPLALIQQSMESRMSVLKRVRELINEVIREGK